MKKILICLILISIVLLPNIVLAPINIPTGTPKIISCNDIEFGANSNGLFTPTVMNYHSSNDGSFEGRIRDCTKDITASGASVKSWINLDAGESKQLTFKMSGDTGTTDNIGSCWFDFKESTTQVTESCQFSVKVVKDQDCVPGAKWSTTEGGIRVVRKCNSNGLSSNVILRCGEGEKTKLDAGLWVCYREEIRESNDNPDWITFLLIFLVIFLVLYFLKISFKKKTKR